MCTPCGFIPNNPNGCQDYSAPHEAEVTEAGVAVQPAMPRMGRISTVCCGWDFLTVPEVLSHREQH